MYIILLFILNKKQHIDKKRLANTQPLVNEKLEPGPVAKSGNTITLGPYNNVSAYSVSPLYLHYASPKAILVASEVKRVVQVSEWGQNLNVLEYYSLNHLGARWGFVLY